MDHIYKRKHIEPGPNVQDRFIELNKEIESMEEKDYILVPKYKLDQAREIAISYMMVIGNERRLEVMSLFCPKCGGDEVPCNKEMCKEV